MKLFQNTYYINPVHIYRPQQFLTGNLRVRERNRPPRGSPQEPVTYLILAEVDVVDSNLFCVMLSQEKRCCHQIANNKRDLNFRVRG